MVRAINLMCLVLAITTIANQSQEISSGRSSLEASDSVRVLALTKQPLRTGLVQAHTRQASTH